ncbi:MAG TPA: methyltransferase domain-containing protein, partial [Gemmatimonadales bacterium]|nr:methyltransferase domain-containing protein [Gemmatimonadales bacterium]
MDSSLWDAIERVERRHWWFRGRRELVTAILRSRLTEGVRVLDVGCGTGFVLERLLDHFDAWGLEPDPSVRARASERAAPRIRAGSTFDLAGVERGSFDAVLLLD